MNDPDSFNHRAEENIKKVDKVFNKTNEGLQPPSTIIKYI